MASIPVLVQLRRARPVLKEMATLRSGGAIILPTDTPETTAAALTESIEAEYRPKSEYAHFPYFEGKPLPATDVDYFVQELYPAYNAYNSQSSTTEDSSMRKIYEVCCMQRLHIDFSQCIEENASQVWMPTQRDNRFQQQLGNLVEKIRTQAITALHNEMHKLNISVPDSIQQEFVSTYMRNYTHVYLYVTRNTKASETLDKKFERMCSETMQEHGIHVQLFNLTSVMFNVTRHGAVPQHERLIGGIHVHEINRMQKRYSVADISELPCISHADPVARFIGLRPNDVCKITRRNQTSGVFTVYRRCTAEGIH